MLYKLTQIEPLIARNPDFKAHKVDLIRFFSAKHIFNDLHIHDVYLNDKQPAFFVNENDIKKICMLASLRFDLSIDFNYFYTGKNGLPVIESSTKDTVHHKVSNYEELEVLLEKHKNTSTYGIESQKIQQKQQANKKAKVEALEEKLEEKRQEKRAEFDKATNLNRDFVQSKIVSIDFEFKIQKDDYMVTELGLAINHKGVITNEHYLVSENYQKKYNRDLQEKFNFGETQKVSMKDLLGIIVNHVKDADFILFHEQREDYAIMKKLGWDIEHSDAPVIDTQLCYKRYFREPGSIPDGEKLVNLLKSFKVEHNHLHNAGNDAHYTLKLLQKMSEIHKHLLNSKNNQKLTLKKPKI